MTKEPTKEEVERLARELAQRVMSQPYRKQEWPGKRAPRPPDNRSSSASERKPRSTGEAS
jgi:hypothetical protein